MPKGNIVFVSFVCLLVCLFLGLSICTSVIQSINTCYNQVLLQSFFNYIYLCSHISETIHIWYRGTWEGSLPFYIYGPVGQNLGCLNKVVYCYNQVLLQSFLIMYISTATCQKLFIFSMEVPVRVLFHSTSIDPWVLPWGRARGQNLGHLNKVVYCSLFILTTFE